MGLFDYTLDALIERTCQLGLEEGTWFEGECDASAVGTLVDATRYEPDDYFQEVGAWARIRTTTDNAAPIGEERKITDWTQSTGTASVLPVFSAAPGASDTYVFLVNYRWAEIREAINAAIDMVARKVLVPLHDETVRLESSVYEYPVPSGFLYVNKISMDNGSGEFPDQVLPDQWHIILGTNPPRIHFERFPREARLAGHTYGNFWAEGGLTEARIIRIEGLARQNTLSLDTDSCQINPDFICYQAAALLHARRIRKQDEDAHSVQFGICQGIADNISGGGPNYSNLTTQLPMNSKRVVL